MAHGSRGGGSHPAADEPPFRLWEDVIGAELRRREVVVWWVALIGGLAAVGTGIVHLTRYFREGPEAARGLAGSGPAHRLVSAAMFTAAGLFLSFFSLANLIAQAAGTR